jgi:hypothetical protein
MYRKKILHRLQLNNHSVADDQVDPVPAVELYSFVCKWELDLLHKIEISQLQLTTKASLVGRLKKTWS